VNSNGTISIKNLNNSDQTVDDKTEKTDNKGTQATVVMAYSTGDRLQFTGTSGNYSTVKIDIPTSSKTITFNFMDCTDGENNNYPIVTIGTQVWMAENLKTSKYNDNTAIPLVEGDCASAYWGSLNPQFCWYNNNISYKDIYGGLYNFAVIKTGKLCPSGWHVPSDIEWQNLEVFLGMTQTQAESTGWRGSDQGMKMKSINGWLSGGNGTNLFGFNAIPSGFRWGDCSGFGGGGVSSYWWSITEFGTYRAWCRNLSYNKAEVYRSNTDNNTYGSFGNSVRCLKD
jgi:uncharacterized protein (TIGR02145 family)